MKKFLMFVLLIVIVETFLLSFVPGRTYVTVPNGLALTQYNPLDLANGQGGVVER